MIQKQIIFLFDGEFMNDKTISVEPGIYSEMSYKDYCMQDAITRRHLILDRNWQRTNYNLVVPKEDTEAMILGRAVHAITLDAPSVDKDFLFTMEYPRTTKEGKEQWEADKALAGSRTIIRGGEAFAIASAVTRHPGAARLLQEGSSEVSVFWKEGIDLCKARLDYLRDGLIVELKTTQSAAPRDFTREIVKYGYHFQAAWYRRGLSKALPVKGVAIIAVEKAAPYCVAVYHFTNAQLDRAEQVLLQRLEDFRMCRETQHWTGYPDDSQEINLPNWAFGDTDLDELTLDF